MDVANILIDAGAEIDATFLDGGSGTTPLVSLVTSVHPHSAGVAADLVETFVDAGARVEGLKGDGQPLCCAVDFGYADSAEALVRCGAKMANILVASGMGRLDLVKGFVERGRVSQQELEQAFLYACKFGHTDVAEFLLKQGVDVDVKKHYEFTGLMWAARYGRIDTLTMLLDHGTSVETQNEFGGTALGTAMWFLANVPEPDADYARVIDLLLNAGSKFDWDIKGTGNEKVDQVLRKHGVYIEQ